MPSTSGLQIAPSTDQIWDFMLSRMIWTKKCPLLMLLEITGSPSSHCVKLNTVFGASLAWLDWLPSPLFLLMASEIHFESHASLFFFMAPKRPYDLDVSSVPLFFVVSISFFENLLKKNCIHPDKKKSLLFEKKKDYKTIWKSQCCLVPRCIGRQWGQTLVLPPN